MQCLHMTLILGSTWALLMILKIHTTCLTNAERPGCNPILWPLRMSGLYGELDICELLSTGLQGDCKMRMRCNAST